MFKSKIVAIALMAFASLSAYAQQSVPNQTTLDSVVWFGTGSVDIEHARIVDITNGNNKITDALGTVRTGYFLSSTTFANTPAYKKYIRAYSGSPIFYNASMFTAPDCENGKTVLRWINGGVTYLDDGCSLKNQIQTYSRNM